MFENYQTPSLSKDAVRQSILKSYMWMAIGLLVTGVVSTVLYSTGAFLALLMSFPMLSLLLMFAQFGIVIAFTIQVRNPYTSASTLKALFMAYAVTLGFSLTSIFYSYDLGIISVAFLVTAIYFGCLVFIGITTKKDMTRFGMICLSGLIALVLSQFVMSLFGFGLTTRLYSILGLLLFTGITVWDVQRMNKIMTYNDGSFVSQDKMGIYFALELYLDFLNIFLYILRLIGLGQRD